MDTMGWCCVWLVLVVLFSSCIHHNIVPSGASYVVKKGDTLWSISNSLDVSVQELQRLNPTVQARQLDPGDASSHTRE